jgi:hypothetical protein
MAILQYRAYPSWTYDVSSSVNCPHAVFAKSLLQSEIFLMPQRHCFVLILHSFPCFVCDRFEGLVAEGAFARFLHYRQSQQSSPSRTAVPARLSCVFFCGQRRSVSCAVAQSWFEFCSLVSWNSTENRNTHALA